MNQNNERKIDFALKILMLSSDLDYKEIDYAQQNFLTETASKALKDCLEIVLASDFVNSDSKIIKIITMLANCYKIPLSQDDQDKISCVIFDKIKLETLENTTAFDIAFRIK